MPHQNWLNFQRCPFDDRDAINCWFASVLFSSLYRIVSLELKMKAFSISRQVALSNKSLQSAFANLGVSSQTATNAFTLLTSELITEHQ